MINKISEWDIDNEKLLCHIVLSDHPPDDEGDGQRTVVWLMEKDLIHLPETEARDRWIKWACEGK